MSYVPPKKNTQYIFYAGLVSRSNGQFQNNPTIAAGDFKVSTDGGALGNLGTLPSVVPASSKMVKFTVSASEMNGDNITIVGSDAAGAEWDDVIVNIQTSVNQIDDIIADTNDIQSRLPAALSGDGFIKADMKSIDDELTSGNNATLNLKQLTIVNSGGTALIAQSTGGNGSGVSISGDIANGIEGAYIEGGYGVILQGWIGEGMVIDSATSNAVLIAPTTSGGAVHGIRVLGDGGGSSIYAPQGIIGSDSEDLSVTNITDKVWDELTAGHTTAGTTGKALTDAGSAGDPWGTSLPGAYIPGQAGHILASRMPTGTVIVSQNNDKSGYSLSSPQVFDLVGNISGTMTNVINVLNPVVAGVVTGSVLGNVNGSVGSVVSPVSMGTGTVNANLVEIDGQPTNGNNATLNLKRLDIRNSSGAAVVIDSTGADGDGVVISGDGNGYGVHVLGGVGMRIEGSGVGDAVQLATSTGRSIAAVNDIELSDGRLNLGNIASAVWANVTRTLTSISDSAGVTTLLTRIASALNIASGKVESNIKQVNDTDITGTGTVGSDPWRKA